MAGREGGGGGGGRFFILLWAFLKLEILKYKSKYSVSYVIVIVNASLLHRL